MLPNCFVQAAEFERTVRAATAEALKLHDPDAERLFAHLLGSYCRGKPETGASASMCRCTLT